MKLLTSLLLSIALFFTSHSPFHQKRLPISPTPIASITPSPTPTLVPSPTIEPTSVPRPTAFVKKTYSTEEMEGLYLMNREEECKAEASGGGTALVAADKDFEHRYGISHAEMNEFIFAHVKQGTEIYDKGYEIQKKYCGY